MYAELRIAHPCLLFKRALVPLLLLAATASQAQSTYFGSGGSSNAALDISNLGFGFQALATNTTGIRNTATGYRALGSNTIGSWNTANGYFALNLNVEGIGNTANGYFGLANNTSGSFNTANGSNALASNTTGVYNTANACQALFNNTTGLGNTADGFQALFVNTTGSLNTAVGNRALAANTTGQFNAANSAYSLLNNTTGSFNTASGGYALLHNTSGSFNIALGYGSGQLLTTGSDNIEIGNRGTSSDTGTIRIGTDGSQQATYIAGINGVTATGGVAVFINAQGQLGTLTSSERFKKDIKDIGAVSDKLMLLRPVTFRYKQAAQNGAYPVQYGLIAEQVAKVFPELVQYDKAGKPFTIYYHLLTPMLLNEVQKSHRQIEAQRTEIAAIKTAQSSEIASLKTELASLRLAQRQQLDALTKLTTQMQASHTGAQAQHVVAVRQ